MKRGRITTGLLALVNIGAYAQTNVTTQHNDIARTGSNINETILTPSNVNTSSFGKLFSTGVDGWVYAQPLYMPGVTMGAGTPQANTTHNVVFVATEHDSVYAFDADNNTGANANPLWKVSMIDAAHGAGTGETTVPSDDLDEPDIVPEVGITSTPVIDTTSNTIYVVAKSTVGGSTYIQRLHALDITTGLEKFGGPVVLSGSVPGNGNGSTGGTLSWDPEWQNNRTSLLLLNGIVYIGFGSHADNGPWHGWILAYSASNVKTQTGAWCSSPNATGAGIWMGGTGLAADVPSGKPYGRIFTTTGNGTFDAAPNYTNSMDYGDSIIKLDLANGIPTMISGGTTVGDDFTPHAQSVLNNEDGDQASGGVVILPDSVGGTGHQLVQLGKSGIIYTLNRESLGGYNPNNKKDVGESANVNGLWGSLAYWNGNVYVWSINNNLMAFGFANGAFTSSNPTSTSSEFVNSYSPTPSISANGTTNGIVWSLDTSAYNSQGRAILYAHNALNVANLLYSSESNVGRDNPGNSVKFVVPTVVNGKVYVGTESQLSVYGLLQGETQAATPAISPSSESFNPSVQVSITDSTPGASIFYTTDGSNPSTASTQYMGPFNVTTTTTVNAIAAGTGVLASAIASATYTLSTQVAIPTFNPPPGSYSSVLSVAISTITPNTTIYYTVDGSTPGTNSTKYTGPVSVGGTETLSAIAVDNNGVLSNSPIASGLYSINLSSINTINLGTGFTSGSMALLGSATLNGTALQLTDGGANEASAAWYHPVDRLDQLEVNIQSFTTDFNFQITPASASTADGFTFTLQGDGVTSIGPNGGGLGYGPATPGGTPGILNSVAVKFDLFNDAGEGSDSTGLYINGVSPTTPAVDMTSSGVNLHSGDIFHVHMTYDGTTLTMTITDTTTNATFTTSWAVNIAAAVGGTSAFVGFTASTAAQTATQQILGWTFTSTSLIPIGFVQVASTAPQTSPTTVSLSYPAAQTSGDLNVVVVGWNDTKASVQSVKDNQGNNYSLAVGPTSGTGLRQSIYYAPTIASGSNTVTVTFNQAAAFPDVRILEYQGVRTLDATAAGSGNSATSSSGAATTTSANELIVGANMVATLTEASGTGYTSRVITTPDGDIAEDKVVTAAGSNTATAALNGGGPWVMQMVTFSAVSGSAPTVSSVSPNSGPTTGGTPVTITGTNFAAGASVTFGSTAATNVVVTNSTTISATTPAGSAGAVTVTVTNSGGQSGNLASAFTYGASPTVTSVSPSNGPTAGGTAVTITGTNFATGATVTFGSAAATSVVVTNSTTITAKTPAGSAGAVTVTVTVNGQSGNLASGFTYLAAPTVTSVSPNSGTTSGGTAVTITGTNFATGATVTFGSTAATSVVVVSGTQITAKTPAGSAGAVTVTVTVGGQSGILSSGFTYIVAPTVTSVSPNNGTTSGGTAVTITGTNFATGATVTFGSTAATNVVVTNSTTITATTPAGSAGAVTVTVTVSGQSGSLASAFTYLAAPTVTSVSPTSGASTGGTAVTITGTNFATGATVTFGSAAATSVVVVSGTQITAKTPAGSAGAVTVTVTVSGQSGSLTSGYTYVVQPTVSSVSPNNGPTAGGTAVTITGANFATGATVTFGSAAATSVVVTNSTTITAKTPAGSAGAVTVTVTVSGQSGSLASGFTYQAAPTVTSVSPASGTTSGGTAVTITGTNFATGATLTFGSTAATNVVVSNSTTITATTPAGSAGAVTVTVTVNGQSGNLASGFTYLAAPTVTSVSPASGTTSGGTAVTISGTNFVTGATVTFGGAAATSVVVTNSTTITAKTPAGSAGAVTVTVTVSGQSGNLTSGYTYVVQPTVTNVSPNSGPAAGGTAVTITGTNFATGATVTFGSTAATSVVVTNSTTITAKSPAGSAGAVTVTVTVSGQSGSLANGFTYVVPPTVTSVAPNNGPAAGGTAVTITGTNFATGATVTFGSGSATSVVVVSGTQITAKTPAGSAGAVTVTVTNVGSLSGSLANGFTYNASVPIAFAQVASATPQSSTATVSVPYPAAQTVGDLNIVVVGWNDTTSTVQSVKDTLGNNYILAIGPTSGTGLRQSIYYAANILAGSNTVTVTFNQAAAFPDIRILEYQGVTTLDVTAGASGNSATSSSGAATTTSPNELIFGANMVATLTVSAGSGFKSRVITTPDGDIAEDKMVTTAGSNTATATLNNAGPWVMQMVTFH